MAKSLAHQCYSSFSIRSRQRGGDYCRLGKVRVVEADPDGLSAEVTGSRRSPYVVDIDWAGASQGIVVAQCTCPLYDDGVLCKHIWAVLLEIDQRGLSLALPAGLEIYHGYEDPSEFGAQGNGDQTGFALDANSVAVVTDHDPDRNAVGPSGLPTWKDRLKRISRDAAAEAKGRSLKPARLSRRREVWFGLNVDSCLKSGSLIVDFLQREARRDGNFGKIKKLNIRVDTLPESFDSADRQLLELLLSGQDSRHGDFAYSYRQLSQVMVSPVLCDLILPRICSTGRFIWQKPNSLPDEQSQPITWDGGGPWRFLLAIEDDPGTEMWRFSGQLQRGDATVPLADAVLLMATGIVLFPDRLAQLELSTGDFAWIASLRGNPSIHVPHSQRPQLLEALHSLPNFPELATPEILKVERIKGEPTGRLEIKKHPHFPTRELFATVSFVYGDDEFRLDDDSCARFDPEEDRILLRDPDKEAELVQKLGVLGMRSVWSSSSYNGQFDLIFHEKRLPQVVAELIQEGWIVNAEGVRIRRAGSFNLSVTSGVDWFELDGHVDFDGVTASLPSLLKAIRNKETYLHLDDGSQGMMPEEWLRKYGHLAEMADGDGMALRFGLSQALLLDALLAEHQNVRVDTDFADFRTKLGSFRDVAPVAEPRGFAGTLREYQKEGLGWLHFLREFRLGGCLADDMGLGKTVQVLALLQSRRLRRVGKGEQRKPSIVVVPKTLVFNWIDEAARFTPRLRIFDYTGPDRGSRLEDTAGIDVMVTTYGTLRRDIVTLKDIAFDYAILDESQAVKNHSSQASKATRLLTADHRLAMTGTPVENHLGELWSLFEFLNPGMLGRATTFQRLRRIGSDDSGLLDVLARALRPFMLRRTKRQVLTELPDKTEQTLYCEMSAKERKEYDQLRDYYRASLSDQVREVGLNKAKIHVLEALLRLRQAACHPGLLDAKRKPELSPKIETLLEQLREVIAEGHKALVFSQFTRLLEIVRYHLDAEQVVYEYLDGRTRQRAGKVKRFQEDPACPLFLISLKAGGQGLNLTAADYVFILDPWWNPVVEAQAIDRAHRMGQTRSVFAYRLICQDTVEDKILALQETKRNLADAIVSADKSLMRSLTTDDLEMLLS